MSVQARLLNAIFAKMKAPDPPDYPAERAQNAARRPDKLPPSVTLQELALNGIHGECLTPATPSGKTVLYIHGGGFTTGSAKERRGITGYLAAQFGCTVYANDYRLSPENVWPAHLEDCLAFYRGMLSAGVDPRSLVLMGESAGGTLVLSLSLLLRDMGLPLPAALAAFSPVTNQAEELPSRRNNIPTDHMLKGALSHPAWSAAVFGCNNNADYRRANYASPLYGDYTGLPPLFLTVSDTEVLYDEVTALYTRLADAKHNVRLTTGHDLCHGYAMIPQLPEAREALAEAAAFCGL